MFVRIKRMLKRFDETPISLSNAYLEFEKLVTLIICHNLIVELNSLRPLIAEGCLKYKRNG